MAGDNGVGHLYHGGKAGALQKKVVKCSGDIYNSGDGDIAHRR